MFGMYRDRVKNKDTKKRISFQRIVQFVSVTLANGYMIGFQKGKIFTGGTKAVCVPVLNCYSCPGALGACPIGSLQAAVGGMKHHFPFYVLGLLMLFGIVLGRVVCGLLCPFGLVQDLFHKIPVPKLNVPENRPARPVHQVYSAAGIGDWPARLCHNENRGNTALLLPSTFVLPEHWAAASL